MVAAQWGGTVRLGTRGSALALRQAEMTAELLRHGVYKAQVEVVVIRTEGDAIQDRPISQFGDKGVFVRAIETALLDGRVDIAVHSLKDVPADLEHPDLMLAGYSARADPRDVLVSRGGEDLAGLSVGARVGTSSLRRRVQLMAVRSDTIATEIRGNVDTRLRKLANGEYDAILLAAAGLHRLGREDCITQYLPMELFAPDAGQGIIALQTRRDSSAREWAAAISDPASTVAALSERAAVRAMHADCRSPVGVHARVRDAEIHLLGMAAREDGSGLVRHELHGPVAVAEELGAEMGRQLLHRLGA